MPILDLQRKLHECGRIRIGQQVAASNGKSRPAKLNTFRLTSPDRTRLDDAAQMWGGTVREWQAPAGQQWEVITETDTLNVVVPPSDVAFSQAYEMWSAGGAQRRCDGVTESIGDRPCVCDPDRRDCQIHTRLSVMLADLSGLGVWRVDTQGWYAAVELAGAVEVIKAAAGHGVLLPARLRLEQRQVKRPDADGKPQTRNFAVPVLDVHITPAQLLGGAGAVRAQLGHVQPNLVNGERLAVEARQLRELEAPRLTPVPANTEPGPSVAAQVVPPPAKPKRANAAPEIPRSGRDRRGLNGGKPEPPNTEATPDPDAATTAQNRKMHVLFKEAEVTERHDRLKLVSIILGRELATSKGLSKDDANSIIDHLERWSGEGHLADHVAAVLYGGQE